MSLILITPPRISNGDSPETFLPLEPVTIEEVKAHTRISDDQVDSDVEGWIASSRTQVEATECWIQLLTATWELRLDRFPVDGKIVLPKPPLQEVISITYTDTEGEEQTLGGSPLPYSVDLMWTPGVMPIEMPNNGEVHLAYGQHWPSTRCQYNAVRVRFKCGFGDSPTDVPASIKHWIYMMCGTLNENRETETLDSRWQESTSIKSSPGLLGAWRAKGWRG